jgi:hypothetical protein
MNNTVVATRCWLVLFRGLVWLIIGGIALQFFLAGLTVFGGGAGWEAHAATGGALVLPILLTFAISFQGTLQPYRRLASLLLAGYLLQVMLAALGDGLPLLGALHPVNGLAMASVAFLLASRLARAWG